MSSTLTQLTDTVHSARVIADKVSALLVRAHTEGCTYTEIGAALGVTRSAAYQRTQHAFATRSRKEETP